MNLQTQIVKAIDEAYERLMDSPTYSSVHVLCCFDGISADIISDIIKPALKEWIYECPPATLYSKFLVASNFPELLSDKLFLLALKAMNYYGNYEKVIELASERIKSEKNIKDSDFFALIKYIGKAYKSLGFHEDALVYYRIAFIRAKKNNDQHQMSYLLILVSKLCNDYHQKKGMYSYYTKLAYQRFEEMYSNNKQGTHVPRILSISRDCYAKSIYALNPEEGDKIYGVVLSTANLESFNRVRMNQLVAKIKFTLSKYPQENYSEIVSLLSELEYLLSQILSIFGNKRAYAVRIIQHSMLCRKFYEKLLSLNLSAQIEDFLALYTIESNLHNLDIGVELCLKFREFKYQAYGLFEQVKWSIIQKRITDKTLNATNFDYEEWISKLHDVIGILSLENINTGKLKNHYIASDIYIEAQHLISDIYIDTQQELSDVYIAMKNFQDAISSYEQLHEHFTVLMDDMQKVSAEITNIIDHKHDLNPEYSDFTREELHGLRASLFYDYENLTNRLLEVGKSINSTQNREMLGVIDDTIALSKNIDYHNLSRYISNALAFFDTSNEADSESLTKIRDSMQDIVRCIDEIRQSNDRLMLVEKFDPVEETNKYIFSSEFTGINGSIQCTSFANEFEINFSKRSFSFIVKSLLYNILEVAKKFRLPSFFTKIHYSQKIDSNNMNVLYIHVRDNVGNIDNYKKVIDGINEITVQKFGIGTGRGAGLKTIKAIISLNVEWQLLTDDNSDEKELIIPLCQLL